MSIYRIDGKLHSALLIQRDTLINANTYLHLGRKNYTAKQLEAINKVKEKQKVFFKESN